ERVGERTSNAGDDDEVRFDAGADHAGDEAQVRRQTVVEAVYDAAQIATSGESMPRFALTADRRGEVLCVLGGFRGDGDRRVVRRFVRGRAGEPRVRPDF